MKKQFSLDQYASQQAFLKDALAYSEKSLHQLFDPSQEIAKPLLCIEEVLTNIINHSNIAESGRIIIAFHLDLNRSLVIEIQDEGERFDLSEYPMNAPQKDIGGAGIRLIRSFMHVSYHQRNGWNVVRLTEKF